MVNYYLFQIYYTGNTSIKNAMYIPFKFKTYNACVNFLYELVNSDMNKELLNYNDLCCYIGHQTNDDYYDLTYRALNDLQHRLRNEKK